VNLAHFGIPQFAEVFPSQYKQDWRRLPREIPDAFVRRFAAWSRDHGVVGKYSIVPYPACVGWIDQRMPGWTQAELAASLEVVRQEIVPHWDIHPEMVTHTFVIDPKTGRPFPERSDRFMENWRWTDGKTAEQMAEYLAYALRPLKNAGLPANGVTTPGGFANRSLPALAQGTRDACREVFATEIPHYFRHVYEDRRSVAPVVQYAAGLAGPDPRCVVSIVACAGDWFGGWDGLLAGSADKFLDRDGQRGRLPEIIARGEPAIMIGHWPGFYANGLEVGFNVLKEIVARLKPHADRTLWMRPSAIARYWAARELTGIALAPQGLDLHAPFAAPDFTLEFPAPAAAVVVAGRRLRPVETRAKLVAGASFSGANRTVACFDLPKGKTAVRWT
jgi:hypothetical protein